MPDSAASEPPADLSNVDWSQAIVCYSRCWSCQFDHHQKPPKPHTWMDEDDAQHYGHPWPLPPEVAATNQCACPCAKPKETDRA